MTPDGLVTVLACSSVAAPRDWDVKPFGPRGWAALGLEAPGRLLGLGPAEIQALGVDAAPAQRLATLLSRSAQLAFELDRLQSRGVWVTTQGDPGYPARLRDRLGRDAPPVLFGAGDLGLLPRGGVAVVGSRDADEAALAFTDRLAGGAAAAGEQVVLGPSRGVAQTAMTAALAGGGTVAAVLAEGVERRIRDVAIRRALAGGRAVVTAPWHPATPWSVGAAMAKHKLIYALADVAVVVSSARESGGTWAGAVEAIDAGWVPVLIRDGPGVPAGNLALLERGGMPLEAGSIGGAISVEELLRVFGASEMAGPREGRAAAGPSGAGSG
jgi:predicted Rossmann fold nucleotide-binding protein DprA/Smf involved in DNA uptake